MVTISPSRMWSRAQLDDDDPLIVYRPAERESWPLLSALDLVTSSPRHEDIKTKTEWDAWSALILRSLSQYSSAFAEEIEVDEPLREPPAKEVVHLEVHSTSPGAFAVADQTTSYFGEGATPEEAFTACLDILRDYRARLATPDRELLPYQQRQLTYLQRLDWL